MNERATYKTCEVDGTQWTGDVNQCPTCQDAMKDKQPGDEIEYRPTPSRLIVGPVKAMCGMLHDAEGNHICDMRGWGRLQYFKGGDVLQDKMGDWVAEAINEKLEKDPI